MGGGRALLLLGAHAFELAAVLITHKNTIIIIYMMHDDASQKCRKMSLVQDANARVVRLLYVGLAGKKVKYG